MSTFPVPSKYHLARALVAAAIVASALSGCSSSIEYDRMPAGPSWSLTDKPMAKPPTGLGANVKSDTPAPDPAGERYVYRGGRDPVTGRAAASIGQAPPAPSQGAAKGPPQDQGLDKVVIKPGDTLHKLSLQHHVSVKALMEANNLTSNKILPGKTLVIPRS